MPKRSSLAAIAAGVSGAVIAGFGLGVGRDSWRATKKNAGGIIFLISALATFYLAFIGSRNLIRSYPARSVIAITWTFILAVLLTAISYAIATCLSALVLIFLLEGEHPRGTMALEYAAVIVLVSSATGLIVGCFQRPSRKRKFAIAEANQRFLDDLGFRETSEDEITHYDGDGNPLRLLERTKDSLVFFAVGRRNRRAYIALGKEGNMTGYTGLIAINNKRSYQRAA